MSRRKKVRWIHRACGHSYEPSKRAEHYRKCPMMVRERIEAALGDNISKRRKKVGSDGKADSTHYGGADNPHETIKCLHAWGLEVDALCWNAAKYISRAGKKAGATLLRDLEKAHYYLGKRIEDLKNEIVRGANAKA